MSRYGKDSNMTSGHNAGRTAVPVWISLLLAVVLVPGCNSSDDGVGEGSVDRPQIALVMKSLANEFFTTMAEGAEKHQQEHSDEYTLLVNGIKDELDLTGQVALVDQMIAAEVDAIVIAPADSKALVPACKRALAAGIPVINIDNKFDAQILKEAGVELPFVGPDNREGARMVGEHLAKQLAEGDEVAIIEGSPTAFNARQRKLGFEDAMNAAGMKIVDSQSGQWEMNEANMVASAMLGEHENLKALLCSNDSMAIGAVAAVKLAGKKGQVAVVGFDNIAAIEPMLAEGRVLATIDQHADQLAVFGIEFALRIIEAETAPADKQTPVDLITGP